MKPAIRLIRLCLLALLCAAPGMLLSQQLPSEMVVSGRFANVRKGPGTGYEKVATLYQGERVLAERKYRNWLRVLVKDGAVGWMREDLLKVWDPQDRPLTDQEADSVKALLEGQGQRVTALEDSARQALTAIQAGEGQRDSLLGVLGLAEVPPPDSIAPPATEPERARPEASVAQPPRQQSLLFPGGGDEPSRWELAPSFGVLAFEEYNLPVAGFALSRGLGRGFAFGGELLFSRLEPQPGEGLAGAAGFTIMAGGLSYSWRPGEVAVPFLELGGGAFHRQAGDSAATKLDLIAGAGLRLYLTPDLPLRFGWRGHLMMDRKRELAHQVYLGLGMLMPQSTGFAGGREHDWYLAPLAGWRVFSPRFGLEAASRQGLLAGRSVTERLGLELAAGYSRAAVAGDREELTLHAVELEGNLRCFPWREGPYLLAGVGLLRLSERGRPPAGTRNYGFFQYGGGAELGFSPGTALRAELAHQVFPRVADAGGDHALGVGHGLRLSGGVRLGF